LVVVVKEREKITLQDVFIPEKGKLEDWRKTWKKWVVIHNGFVYDSYDSKEQAETRAEDFKTIDFVEDLRERATDAIADYLRSLSKRKIQALRDYFGEYLRIEVQLEVGAEQANDN